MLQCYAYIRVSTVRQGEKGVSLQEQRAAIERYAERQSIHIIEWFEEKVTAAKLGRPLFTKMLKDLRRGAAQGVVIHKIDRGARNLRDWAAIAELNDAGIGVHFANESVDLQSRGGRLSADIQAVVAADYVRNLREETLKGMYGRLKQGIFPFAAPIGYLDAGAGRAKTIDPERGHLIREAFQLYATGRYTQDTLRAELHRRGLRNKGGRPIGRRCISEALNNPFYVGLMRVRTTGETFDGKHEPLIDAALFQQVRTRLSSRVRTREWKHDFEFRGLLECGFCARPLVGEWQKGRVYYRCHTKDCGTKCVREDAVEAALNAAWPAIAATESDLGSLREQLNYVYQFDRQSVESVADRRRAQLTNAKNRMTRLVDAFLDDQLDKQMFEDRKSALLLEQRELEELIAKASDPNSDPVRRYLDEAFELLSVAQQSYSLGNTASRREMAIRLCSNRRVIGKQVVVEPYYLLRLIENRSLAPTGDPSLPATRTFSRRTAWEVLSWAKRYLKRNGPDGLSPAGSQKPVRCRKDTVGPKAIEGAQQA